ncbi:MAG TPA: heme o synthase [Candidatus Saccharimonadales bacterium]|jgi:protoheme IX farnesyltransferase
MLKAYYELAKPERTLANVIMAASGFLFASRWHVAWPLFFFTLIGIALIIASACIVNNYTDRGLDEKMARAKHRALVTGAVSKQKALIAAIVLGLVGFAILAVHVNWLVVVLGAIAYVDYVVLYGWVKRRSVHGALAGTISGAMPIVAGYCAVTDHVDAAAIVLFLIMALWQMPHFYAIAIYRLKDYRHAGVPVMPAKKGIYATKQQIVLYTFAFIVAALMLNAFSSTGYTYALVMAALGLAWLWLAVQGFSADNDAAWAKRFFMFSLVINLALAIMIPLGAVLP